VLGRVIGPFALRGWIKIKCYTEEPGDILNYRSWLLHKRGAQWPVTVLRGRVHGQGVIAYLDGYVDRDQAAELSGADIAVSIEQLPRLAKGEYYWAQLIGLTVVTTHGTQLGMIEYLFATGANDVMVVRGEREWLLPYIPQVVQEVKLHQQLMVVDWDPEF